MFLSKIKISAAVALLLGAIGAAAGFLPTLQAETAPVANQVEADKPSPDTPNNDEEHPATATMEVPSERDGRIALVGTEIKEGEKVPDKDRVSVAIGFLAVRAGDHGDKDYVPWKEGEPLLPGKVFIVREKRAYRKLHIGDPIEKGQLLALVDSPIQLIEVASRVAKLETAEADWRAAIKVKDEAIRRAQATEILVTKGNLDISEDVYQADLLNRDRYIEEEKAKDAARKMANEDLVAALTILKMYEIRSSDSGVLKDILKRPGEGVHAFEPVVRLVIDSDPRDVRKTPVAVVNVPAQRAGVLVVVGTETKVGAKTPAELLVTVKVDGKVKKYRLLRVGDVVEEGQLLACVDDRLPRLELEMQESKLKALETTESGTQLMRQAQVAVKEAQIVLEMVEIRSPARGVVKAILKSRGEAVKSLETVVQIQERRNEKP